MDTVYDATVVTYANGDLIGRRRGNKLDRRMCALEECFSGLRVAWYNRKLLAEYECHVRLRRNDLIEAFFRHLSDSGRFVTRNTLTRQDYGRARRIRWPAHDQHLLAAAVEGTQATLFVTERSLADCATEVKREFGVSVVAV